MDFTRYPTRKKYLNSANGKEYDTNGSSRTITINGQHDVTKYISKHRIWKKNIKASDLKALQILFDVEYSEFFKD